VTLDAVQAPYYFRTWIRVGGEGGGGGKIFANFLFSDRNLVIPLYRDKKKYKYSIRVSKALDLKSIENQGLGFVTHGMQSLKDGFS
jgi:hypothetical protein